MTDKQKVQALIDNQRAEIAETKAQIVGVRSVIADTLAIVLPIFEEQLNVLESVVEFAAETKSSS